MINGPEPQEPPVPLREIFGELFALVVAFIIPPTLLIFDLADREPDLFQRGGLVALFIVAVLQFKSLTDLNRKHINNALRVRNGHPIQEISTARTILNLWTFIVATYASAISAFGDKFVFALLKIIYD